MLYGSSEAHVCVECQPLHHVQRPNHTTSEVDPIKTTVNTNNAQQSRQYTRCHHSARPCGMYSSVHTSLQLDGTHTVPRQLRLLRVAVSRRVCFRRVSPRTDQIHHYLDHLGRSDQIYHDLDILDPIPPLCYRVQDTCSTDPAQEPCPRPCRLYGSHPAT